MFDPMRKIRRGWNEMQTEFRSFMGDGSQLGISCAQISELRAVIRIKNTWKFQAPRFPRGNAKSAGDFGYGESNMLDKQNLEY
jgi:hypothetical protein